MEPNIIYEDNHVIVVIKPHNVAVQEDDSKDLDMLTIIKNFIKKRDNKQGNVFLGLVHRLDRPTGGVMVFAKTSKAAARLTEQLKNKEFSKKYLAVVVGKPKYKASRLEHFLQKDEKKCQNMSKNAIILFEEYFDADKIYDELSSHLENLGRKLKKWNMQL